MMLNTEIESVVDSTIGAEITTEQQQRLAEHAAQRILGIGFVEFARRWDAGEYRDCGDPRIADVAFYVT